MNNPTVTNIAMKDIQEYLEKNFKIGGRYANYIITNEHLFTSESKRLNKELGIHKINKFKKWKNYSFTI